MAEKIQELKISVSSMESLVMKQIFDGQNLTKEVPSHIVTISH